jgi:hypothetical protein
MRMRDALAAQADAAPLAGAVDPGVLLDHVAARPPNLPEDARAVIQCPAPSVLSAGRRRATEWVLAFEPRARPCVEPLMGWTGGADTLSQMRLRFPSREAAIGYARRHGLPYEVREPMHIRAGDLARAQRNLRAAEGAIPPEIGWACDAPHLIFGQGSAEQGTGARGIGAKAA